LQKPLAFFAEIMLDSLFCLQMPERKFHILAAPQGQAHLPEHHIQNPHRPAPREALLTQPGYQVPASTQISAHKPASISVGIRETV
jgi:hypothetical protein